MRMSVFCKVLRVAAHNLFRYRLLLNIKEVRFRVVTLWRRVIKRSGFATSEQQASSEREKNNVNIYGIKSGQILSCSKRIRAWWPERGMSRNLDSRINHRKIHKWEIIFRKICRTNVDDALQVEVSQSRRIRRRSRMSRNRWIHTQVRYSVGWSIYEVGIESSVILARVQLLWSTNQYSTSSQMVENPNHHSCVCVCACVRACVHARAVLAMRNPSVEWERSFCEHDVRAAVAQGSNGARLVKSQVEKVHGRSGSAGRWSNVCFD